MTSQTSRTRAGGAPCGAVASGALAADVASATAWPRRGRTRCTDAAAPDAGRDDADRRSTIIAAEYDTGAGGGQISNLIHRP